MYNVSVMRTVKEAKEKKEKKTPAERTRDVVYVALFAALISVCSYLTVPAVIPFTLQTFGIFVTLGLLGGKRGTAAVLCYVLLGAFGLPVFSGFRGGIAVLGGPTGGYIAGFVVSALVYWGITALLGDKLLVKCLAMVVGLVAVYAFGTAWFVFVMGKSSPVTVGYALSVCVVPFIPFDCAKIALALFMSKVLFKAVNRNMKKARG